jgi:hypothetical protein
MIPSGFAFDAFSRWATSAVDLERLVSILGILLLTRFVLGYVPVIGPLLRMLETSLAMSMLALALALSGVQVTQITNAIWTVSKSFWKC